MELTKLIRKGESETLEFKPSLSQKDNICKALSAFSNSGGGTVLIGVSDNGRVVGIDIGRRTLEDLAGYVKENTDPPMFPSIKQVEIGKKKIVAITVDESKEKPVFFKDKAYKRVGKSTHRILSSELRRLARESGTKVYWDEQVCKATLRDIGEEKIQQFLRRAKQERGLDVNLKISIKEALSKLNLMRNGKLTNAAILMFAKKPQDFFLQSEVKCARFKGTTTKEFIDMAGFSGSAYEQVDDAEKFVLKNIKKAAWIEEGKIERQEKWEYPPEAIREAITNAIVHRDYETSSKVQVRIFDDRIEVWNPGRLPDGWTVDDLKKEHESKPFNPLLARQFFLMRYIEEWGRGTIDMIDECTKHGLPEPKFEASPTSIIVTFRKPLSQEELVKLDLNERQIKAIDYVVKEGFINNKEYQDINNVSRKTATTGLTNLVKKGVFSRLGKGKRNMRYILLSKDYAKTTQKITQKPHITK